MAYTTIDDPSEYFQTAIYSGNSSTLAVTSQGNATIAPDWVWVKRRNSSSLYALVDSSRGRAKSLGSESTDAEYNTSATDKDLISFDTNGFTVGQPNQRNMNGNGDTFVAWQWKANGGTTASNTDGTITSTVQANTDAGFNIVTYTGTGSNATVGHGLGGTPDFITTKSRNVDARGWTTWTNALAGNQALDLNGTDATYTSTTSWNSTVPNSSVISLGTRLGTNENNTTYVAYCFKNIQGYSKIGKYIGNGNANGTFVHTGFKPAWVMLKRTDGADDWGIHDAKRSPFNTTIAHLSPNKQDAEGDYTSTSFDFLSNGFKCRSSNAFLNGSGSSYIYIAFAEHPFVSSEGVPTTAR